MKIIDVRSMALAERQKLLAKPSFAEYVLSPRVQDGIKEMFGEVLTAEQVVERIVQAVRSEGDTKLLYYTGLLDGAVLTAAELRVTTEEIAEASQRVAPPVLAALGRAIENVRRFHEEQRPKTWLTERKKGAMLGQKVTPVSSAGIYVPGGSAAYPSSVIMNAVPAIVAGVPRIAMAVPPGRDGRINDAGLAAAGLLGITEIYKMGGAQAIAALAFGTESVPKVDKITGPGNIFVTLAKKAVYGFCDIDMLAGPSEILIIADEKADAQLLAADLLGQAEHDPLASSVLITTDFALGEQTLKEVELQLKKITRAEIAGQAIAAQGKIIVVEDLTEAVALANIAAPEHLEIMTEEPFALLPYIQNAGAIFLGASSPEPLGDYYAGPNHILPTGGTAKFFSVLNVETFMKKSSIIAYTPEALAEDAEDIITLAEAEGLTAHAAAIRVRLQKEN